MSEPQVPTRVSTVDVLERVLDKGIVIDAQIDISVAGIRLINVDARVLVSSFQAYLRYADALAATSTTPLRPALHSRSAPASSAARTGPLARRRSRRVRRRPLVTLACVSGCTFLRRLHESQTADAVDCPYRGGAVCVLKPVVA